MMRQGVDVVSFFTEMVQSEAVKVGTPHHTLHINIFKTASHHTPHTNILKCCEAHKHTSYDIYTVHINPADTLLSHAHHPLTSRHRDITTALHLNLCPVSSEHLNRT
jgi:hypothetical protein